MMMLDAIRQLGCRAGYKDGGDPTSEQEYHERVIVYEGTLPPWSDVVAAMRSPDMVDAERDRRLQTITFNGAVYDFCDSKESDKNIAGAATLALAAIVSGAQPGNLRWSNPDRDFAWIAHDNSLVTMDAQTMLAFGMHAADTKAGHIYAARVLKNMSPIPADFADNARWPAP